MPNPNAIVSTTIRLEPPLDRPPAEMLRAEGGLSVELEGARRVRLDPADSRSAGIAQVLDGLSKRRFPVYLEIDPVTSAITRLLIPHIARVVGVSATDEGVLTVQLEPSHARHVLQLGQPDSADLERQLREALQSGRPIILTEDDAHNIIHIRTFTPGPDGPMPPFLALSAPLKPKLPPRLPRPFLPDLGSVSPDVVVASVAVVVVPVPFHGQRSADLQFDACDQLRSAHGPRTVHTLPLPRRWLLGTSP